MKYLFLAFLPALSGWSPTGVLLSCVLHANRTRLNLVQKQRKVILQSKKLLFSCYVVFGCLWPHGLQYDRLPCPSPSPRVCSYSCPLCQWCYLTISSSAALFSFCLQSFPASGSFPVSQLFSSGGQNIGAVASALVLPMTIQGWFLLGLTGLIPLQSKGLSRIFSHTTIQKHQFLGAQFSFWSSSHTFLVQHLTPGKTIALTLQTFVSKVMSLLFNMLSRFIIAFLPRSIFYFFYFFFIYFY